MRKKPGKKLYNVRDDAPHLVLYHSRVHACAPACGFRAAHARTRGSSHSRFRLKIPRPGKRCAFPCRVTRWISIAARSPGAQTAPRSQEGVGLKEASIVAGPVGAATRLRVQASDPDGNAGAAEASIQPSEMDMLWSTDSYVPSFHHGRALAGTNAKVRAYAFVSFARAGGPRIPESDIIYRWLRNGTAVTSVSGRGKSSASFPGPAPLRSDTITVEAEAVDKSVSARASATIPATEPVLALYENHPLFGILFHRAIVGDVNTDEHEGKVTAIPYFAHISSLNDPTLVRMARERHAHHAGFRRTGDTHDYGG